LTQQLLGYARKGNIENTTLDLNRLIEETSDSFKRTRRHISIVTHLAPNLCTINGDASQMRQILYNLYINATDAMPKGGELSLQTANIHSDNMKGRSYKPTRNNYVSITIKDTGTGMDKNTLDHLFEPFFTTKKRGKGTGLGLASVYGIVKSHGGYIDVKSELGKGTAFNIYLPISDKKRNAAVHASSEPIRKSGTALVVEDEKKILDLCAAMLEAIGFHVIKAASGPKAIDIFRRRAENIDLILLDMIMPEMSGEAVYNQIRAISPNVKFLFSSGYGLNAHAAQFLDNGNADFIQKPFDIKKLARKIDQILSGH
jgi:CheY-like chemotaxis protein